MQLISDKFTETAVVKLCPDSQGNVFTLPSTTPVWGMSVDERVKIRIGIQPKFQGLDEQDAAGWNNAVTDSNPFSVVCWDASQKLAPLPCDVHPGSDSTYMLRCTRQQQIFDSERELRWQLRSVCIRRTEILAHGEGCIPGICTHNDVTAWDDRAQATSGVAQKRWRKCCC